MKAILRPGSTIALFAGSVLLFTGMVRAESKPVTPKKIYVKMETASLQDGGTALLTPDGNGVKFAVKFKGLDPGLHAVHIHQNASCDAPDFKTAGGHFNPTGKQHGYENPQGHHAGDIPMNLKVGDDGMVQATFVDKDVTLNPSASNSLFLNGGTSIIVHKSADDMKTDPSGNAGARESCGIISIKDKASKLPPHENTKDVQAASNH